MTVTAVNTVREIVDSMLTSVPPAASIFADIRYFCAVTLLILPQCLSRNCEVFAIFTRIQ